MILRHATAVSIGLVVPVLLILLWWFASADSTSPYYPPLQEIAEKFRETWLFSHVSSDAIPSVRRMFLGYGLAIVVGVGAGLLLGRNRMLDTAFQPSIQFTRAIPAAALVPVGTVLLGIGDTPKVLIIALVCTFPILLNTIDGVRAIDSALEDVGRSFRLSRRQRILSIQLPSAAPQVFAGMRVAFAFAFIIMVVTEMVGARNGIGYVTINAQQSFQIAEMWAGVVLLGLLGAAFNLAFVLIERRVIHWHYRSRKG